MIEDPGVVDRLKGAVDKERNLEWLKGEYGVSAFFEALRRKRRGGVTRELFAAVIESHPRRFVGILGHTR